jgi:GT2 family glycosyltransferase
MDISISIVSWNVKDLLKQCLASLGVLCRGFTHEIFVVDNNSSDESVAMVRAEFPAVRLIALKENKGFSGANNEALRRASGRYVVLLNPDTRLKDNAFLAMVSFMEAHQEAAGLAPRLEYPDGSVQASCRHFPTPLIDFFESLYLDHMFPRSRFFNRYRMGEWRHDTLREVDQPYGACLMFRQSVLSEVGLMDERFFMYYDEVDLCYRVKRAGGKIYFNPEISIVHYANQSSNQAQAACELYKAKSRFLFFGKHYGVFGQVALFLNLLVRSFMVWAVFGLTRFVVRRPRSLESFRGPVRVLWRGYLGVAQDDKCS